MVIMKRSVFLLDHNALRTGSQHTYSNNPSEARLCANTQILMFWNIQYWKQKNFFPFSTEEKNSALQKVYQEHMFTFSK